MKAESNNQYKGIILAGGSGTRLYPVTQVISKQLLPVYNKPMIYYPLSVLMFSGIRDILLITTPHEQHLFKALLKDGSQWGIEIKYEIQPKPEGLAQAFIIGKNFIGDSNVTLILGDNIFYGHGLTEILQREIKRNKGATVFGYWVKDPERYGVAEVSDNFKVISIEEKPAKPRSNFAVTGLYFYDNQVVEFASNLKPSARGELEISDINNLYLKKGELRAELLGRGFAWLDTGTHESLLEASTFIETIEKRQGQQIACIEEIAFNMGYIDKQQVIKLAEPFIKNSYGQYLINIAKDPIRR
jgi:glucose-1-phosphate thymidylyltransferase